MFESIFDKLRSECKAKCKKDKSELFNDKLGRAWFIRCQHCRQRLLLISYKFLSGISHRIEINKILTCPCDKTKQETNSFVFYTPFDLTM